jgi:hypothetical protein
MRRNTHNWTYITISPHDTNYHCGASIIFPLLCYFCLNAVGPFCTHVSFCCPKPSAEKQTGNFDGAQSDTQVRLYQYNSNNMQQLQETVVMQTHFIHISPLNYYFDVLNMCCVSFYIVAWETKSFNKRKFVSLIESDKLWKKKGWEDNLRIWAQNIPSTVKLGTFCCSVI